MSLKEVEAIKSPKKNKKKKQKKNASNEGHVRVWVAWNVEPGDKWKKNESEKKKEKGIKRKEKTSATRLKKGWKPSKTR